MLILERQQNLRCPSLRSNKRCIQTSTQCLSLYDSAMSINGVKPLPHCSQFQMVRIVIRDLYVPLVDESDLLLAQLEAINHHITGLDIQNTGYV